MNDEKIDFGDIFEGRLYIHIFEKEKEDLEGVITESDLKAFFRCAYSYFIKKHIAPSRIPKLVSSAQSLMFRQARKSLFNLKDPEIGRLFPYQSRAGPDWKLAEEMTPEELGKYLANSSAEAFGNALRGKWLYFVEEGKYAGSPLAHSFNSHVPVAGNQLSVAGRKYYEFVIQHGAPLLGFINDNETFRFDGHLFSVLLPEVRRGPIIDDPTIWKFNADEKFDRRKNDINTSSLVTLRMLGLASLLNEEGSPFPHRHFVRKLGVGHERFGHWRDSGSLLLPGLRYRHLESMSGVLTETARDDSHLDLLKRAIELFQERTEKELFAPDHRNCGFCPYNVLDMNGDVVCRNVKPGAKPAVSDYFFRKRSYLLEASRRGSLDEDVLVVAGRMMKDSRASHQVNLLAITLSERDGVIEAVSRYESRARGLGLEDKILERADAELQHIADVRQAKVVHTVGFDRYFKFAGQKSVRRKLEQMGYVAYVKEYLPR